MTRTMITVNIDRTEPVALHDQAGIQATVYDALEVAVPPDARPAVVLAPPFGAIWLPNHDLAARGTWVLDWRRPRPDFGDDILILHDVPEAAETVRRAFPGRRLFRMDADASGPAPFRLTSIP